MRALMNHNTNSERWLPFAIGCLFAMCAILGVELYSPFIPRTIAFGTLLCIGWVTVLIYRLNSKDKGE